MNTTKGSPLGTNNETAKNLLDLRIILAVLWVAGMLSSLNGDTYRLSAMTNPLGVSSEQLSVFAVLLVGHVLMSGLTLTLKSPVSRWANRIIGIFYAMFILAFEALHLFVWRSAGYEIVWSTAQLVFALMVVWYAWKWTNPEGQPSLENPTNTIPLLRNGLAKALCYSRRQNESDCSERLRFTRCSQTG